MENFENKIEILEPVFKENYTAIAMSSSDEYIPYLSVCLQSLVEHASDEHYYDIVIFETSISDENKNILREYVQRNNISIRFINPKIYFKNKSLYTYDHVSKETYYKLAIPLVMTAYKKVLFLDSDIIITKDIKELYNTDLDSYSTGACICCMWNGLMNMNKKLYDYTVKELELNIPQNYFQGGVLLIDIEKWNIKQYSQLLLNAVSEKNWKCADQSALNYILKNDIKIISNVWNHETVQKGNFEKAILNMDENIAQIYNEGKNYHFIIHYAGCNKPWIAPTESYAYIWWYYARKSPYYEIILERLLVTNRLSTIQNAINYRQNILKYWRYKILCNITFGKTKQHYQAKKTNLKNKILIGKQFRGIK